jgi:hypothetical protein
VLPAERHHKPSGKLMFEILADRAKTLDRNGSEHHSNPAGLPADISLQLGWGA